MFSKTFEQIKQDNLLLWDKTQGNDFNKAYALLRNYCGYDSYTFTYYTLYYVNTHRDAIYNIVAMYDYDKKGYLKTHPQALVCNIAFLLFYISKKIIRDTINPDGRFLAMMHVIEEKTGLQMNTFYQENLVLHAFFKDNEIHQHILECQSWTYFILKNIKHFPPNIENNTIQHPINVKSLQLKPYYLRAMDLIDTCESIVVNSSEINALLYCDKVKKYSLPVINVSDLFHEALAQLPYDTLSYFFEKMLHNNAYQAALNLFFLAEKLIKTKDSYYYSVSNYEELISKLVDTISGPIEGAWLLKLIAHHNKNYIYSGKVIDWYGALHAKKQFITHFGQVEKAFITCFKPNMYRVFLNAVKWHNKALIAYLIQSNYIDLRNNTIISYDYLEKFSRGFDSFVYDDKDGITFTPLQASLLLASFTNHFNLPFLLDVIRLMVAHAPGCVNILDSVERNVGCYVKKIKDGFKYKIGYENQIEQINVIEKLLDNTYTANRNVALYQLLKAFSNSDLYLPNELIISISLLFGDIKDTHIELPKPIESFEISLTDYRYKEVLTYSGNPEKSFYRI